MSAPVGGGHVLVIGSAGIDIVGRPTGDLLAGASTPGSLRTSLGGVARNVAENLARLGADVILITAVGADIEGARLLEETAAAGVDVEHCLPVEGAATGAYLGVLDGGGNLQHALDDMRVIENITPEFLRQRRQLFQGASAAFVDANLPPQTLAAAVGLARRSGVPVAADTATLSLATRLVPHLKDLWLITPNQAEAEQLCPVASTLAGRERASDVARWLVSQGVDIAIVAMAEFGVVYAAPEGSGHVPAIHTVVVEPTGAGDALTAAVMFSLINEIPVDEAVRLGVSAASLTLRTRGSVFQDLSLERLYEELR